MEHLLSAKGCGAGLGKRETNRLSIFTSRDTGYPLQPPKGQEKSRNVSHVEQQVAFTLREG